MAKINLDALIPREDFETEGNFNSSNLKNNISISDLTNNFFYPFLRKPDFQRETSEWDQTKIVQFIESYIYGDLIPSIILWRSNSGLFFVIDGAHRLSALASWIHDDFGDGPISKKYYDDNIPVDQLKIAEEARKYVYKKVGAYKEITNSALTTNPNNLKLIQIAKNLGAFSMQVQWVDGDASKAEKSFFKINQQGAPLNDTELKLLKSRKFPNCIAARAIIRSGTGYKYWSNFSADRQNKIEEIAKEINDILFSPPLSTPIKSLDLPIAGKTSSAQALPLILDFVNLANGLPANFENIEALQEDLVGDQTYLYLSRARKIAWRINSMHASSLGLHPIIYFYSPEGRHKTASFYGIVLFLMDLENKNQYKEFIKIRPIFEEMIVKYDYLLQDIGRKYRQAISAAPYIKEFLSSVFLLLQGSKNLDEVVSDVIKYENFKYLKITPSKHLDYSKDFSDDKKSAVFMKEAIRNALKCGICKGLISKNSITIDHVTRKQDGGLGNVENGQLAHPYCNSTYKN